MKRSKHMANYSAEITQKFLDKYKELEYIENYDRARFEKIRRTDVQLFDTLRHIRNCLTHTPKIYDEFPFHVSDYSLSLLEETISKIMLKVIEIGTPIDKIKTVPESMSIMDALVFMDKNNISSVPIFDEKGFVKFVISNRAILHLLATLPDDASGETPISEISEYFGLNSNKDIYFAFMAEDDYAFDAKQLFIGYNGEHKSCHLIFITEDGRRDQPVKAIVTPRDVFEL